MKKINTQSVFTEIKRALCTLTMSLVSALNLHILIIPAEFAPGGVDGLSTMLSYLTDIGTGWFIFAINMPLLVLAWFVLKKKFVAYTILYTVCSSGFLVVLENINFFQLELPNEKLLAAIFSGVILGIRTGLMLKIGASTGGVDIVAGCISKFKPHINTEKIITFISYGIVILSGFVYHNILSVMLSLVQMFVFNLAAERMLKDTRNAVEFRINTKDPSLITDKIIYVLKHGATITECEGVFTKEKRYIITTVINIRQIPDMLSIVKSDETAFVSYTEAKGIKGNFRWKKDDEVK